MVLLIRFSWALEPQGRRRSFWCSTWSPRRRSLWGPSSGSRSPRADSAAKILMVLPILVYAAEIFTVFLIWLSWALGPPARRRPLWCSLSWSTRQRSIWRASPGFRGPSRPRRGGDLYGAPQLGLRGGDLYGAPHLVSVGPRAAGAAETSRVLPNLVYADSLPTIMAGQQQRRHQVSGCRILVLLQVLGAAASSLCSERAGRSQLHLGSLDPSQHTSR